jgi:sarcosine oxidase subunit beta
MNQADVVIVGAGIVGAAIAAHLVQAGRKRVLVVDRDGVAAGQTRRSAGVVRAHLHDEAEARLAADSLALFKADPTRTGFVETGLLLLLPQERAMEAATKAEQLRNVGVESHCLTAVEAQRLEPALVAVDEIAVWEPGAGFVDPVKATQSLLEMAVRAGAEVRIGATATVIQDTRGEVTGVHLGGERITCSQVVLATGVASNQVLTTICGIPPMQQARVVLAHVMGVPAQRIVIDSVQGMLVRPGAGEVAAGLSRRQFLAAGAQVQPPQPQELKDLVVAIRRRYRSASPMVTRATEGVYDMTDDGRPLLGSVPHRRGLYIAAGFCGGGLKFAPSVGRIMARHLQGEPLPPWLEAWDINRYAGLWQPAAEQLKGGH